MTTELMSLKIGVMGGVVIGVSPGLSLDEHAFKYESPTLAHDVLIFTGSGLMGREVVDRVKRIQLRWMAASRMSFVGCGLHRRRPQPGGL